MLARNNTNPAQWLSRRELECCKLACLGYSNKQIADLLSRSIKTIEKHKQACFEKLELSIHTVRNYIRRIYHKLDAHSCTEAVVKYLDHESNILPRQPATQLCAGPALGPRETPALKHTTA